MHMSHVHFTLNICVHIVLNEHCTFFVTKIKNPHYSLKIDWINFCNLTIYTELNVQNPQFLDLHNQLLFSSFHFMATELNGLKMVLNENKKIKVGHD
jgi:hypothetical protein